MNEDTPSDNDNENMLPFLGDPEHEFLGETTTPSNNLIGAAAFKQLINVGEEVYTINIQLTTDHQNIVAL